MRLNMTEWILTASIFILMVLLIRLIFKKRLAAKIRYGIWLLVLLRLLLPFSLFNSSLSLLNLFPGQEAVNEADQAEPWRMQTGQEGTPSQTQTVPGQQQTAFLENGAQESTTVQSDDFLSSDAVSWKKFLSIFWASGMAVTLLVVLGSNLYFFRKVRGSRRRIQVLQEKHPLPVYLSEAVPVPCMFGLLRPSVYVREQDTDNEESLLYILKHEYTHYRHGDHIWSFFRGLCLILHWYNPLVWMAAYFSKMDAELACDESVIRHFTAKEAEEYGKVLISLTLQNTDYWTMLSCATTFGGGKNYLKERISRIAKRPGLFIFSTAAVIALCIVALLFTFTGNAKESDAEEETEVEEFVPLEGEIFVNDVLVDLNGDGIEDIIRLSSVGGESPDSSLEENAALKKAVEENNYGYYQIAVYDGAYAADMQTFQTGDKLNEEAQVDAFQLAQAHAGNGQYSYYEESGRGFLISNNPYMGQGVGGYSYEVFTYSNAWEKEVVEENDLSFSIIPYSPEISRESPQDYMAESFPVEDMVAYTMELKSWLDRALIIMDTSTFGQVLFTTCYEDGVLQPDAFSIWPWNEWAELSLVQPEKIHSEEALREALSDMYEAVMYGQNGFIVDIDEEAGLALQNELEWEITYQWDDAYLLGATTYGGYAVNRLSDDFEERMPENALSLPYYIVDFAMQYMDDTIQGTSNGQQAESLWEDWKMIQLDYYGTYRMGDHTLDIFRYDYYCKLDENIDVNDLDASFWAGGMTDMGDGWYQFDYGCCIIYDRENDRCFAGGSNDSSPGQGAFTRDLLFDYARELGLRED